MVSALVGDSGYKLIPNDIIASFTAIPIAMVPMHRLRCMHSPGGATEVTAVIGGSVVQDLGYVFVIVPVFFNAIMLLSIAMAAGTLRENNLCEVY